MVNAMANSPPATLMRMHCGQAPRTPWYKKFIAIQLIQHRLSLGRNLTPETLLKKTIQPQPHRTVNFFVSAEILGDLRFRRKTHFKLGKT